MRGKKKLLTPREVFAKNVKRARLFKGLSQEAVALEAGMTPRYISDLERGARNIAIDNMGRLSVALKVPLHELLDPERFYDPVEKA